jgi:hypothetical protein
MLQITKSGVRSSFYKEGNWYYSDTLKPIEEKYQQGYKTSALKRSSNRINPKEYSSDDLKILADIKAKHNPK